MNVWDVEQLRVFIQHVQDDGYFAGWLLFATTGMRRGEVAGLTWPDIEVIEPASPITSRSSYPVRRLRSPWRTRS
jgi:integrase